MPQVLKTVREMRAAVDARRRKGARIGVVPTMGALHAGHLSLVQASRASCEVTVATIFVNPTQFAPHEDFSRYPRTLEEDLALLAKEGTDYVFCPNVEEMYPAGYSTYVEPPAVSQRLEGERRPGHFRGVCTVVLKLFEAIPADVAYFGQKDFQQALVIQHMVRDLGLRPKIEVRPIIRDADGLALSSRNRYLSPEERIRALGLSAALRAARDAFRGGERSGDSLRERMRRILTERGVDEIDYVSISDRETLEELQQATDQAVALVAARVGGTRLIDNELFSDSTADALGLSPTPQE